MKNKEIEELKRRIEELERENKRLKMIGNIALSMVSASPKDHLDLKDVLSDMFSRISSVIDYKGIMFYVKEKDMYILYAYNGIPENIVHAFNRIEENRWDINNTDDYMEVELSLDPDIIWNENGINRIGIYPIRRSERDIGMMIITLDDPLSGDDIELLHFIAGEMAINIENAILYKEVKMKADRLKALTEITSIINSSFNTEDIIKIASSWIYKFVHFEEIVFLVKDDYWKIYKYGSDGKKKDININSSDYSDIKRYVSDNNPVYIVVDDNIRSFLPLSKNIKFLYVYPLTIKNEIIGYIIVGMKNLTMLLQDEDAIKEMADHLSVALNNSRMFILVEKAKREWEDSMDAIDDMIALVDIDTMTIKRANKKVIDTIGDIKGKKLADIWKDNDVLYESIERIRNGEKNVEVDIEDKRKNKIYRINAYPVKGKNKIESAVIIIRDITDDKEKEEMAIQAEKIRVLGEMAAGVAHNFNNILAAILGRTQLLLNQEKDDKKKKWLQVIEKMSLDGAAMVKRIQDFTRVRQGVRFEDVNIVDVVKESLEIARPYWEDVAHKNGIKIEIEEFYESENIFVAGQSSELKEVFANIIINAVDAMPEGGKIRVSVNKKSKDVLVSIKDTGIGMDEHVLKNIFNPFFTTKGTKGNGLGLSVAYGIITRHNGTIDVFSKKGKGSEFVITLPMKEFEKVRKEKEEYEERKFDIKDIGVLLIDDEEELRDILKDIIEEMGFKNVIAVSSGEEGIDVLSKNNIGIVCTDLGMPGMNGWDVSEKAKEINPDIKVILLTGWGAQIEREEMEKHRVDGILSKPFTIKDFEKVLKEVVDI